MYIYYVVFCFFYQKIPPGCVCEGIYFDKSDWTDTQWICEITKVCHEGGCNKKYRFYVKHILYDKGFY